MFLHLSVSHSVHGGSKECTSALVTHPVVTPPGQIHLVTHPWTHTHTLATALDTPQTPQGHASPDTSLDTHNPWTHITPWTHTHTHTHKHTPGHTHPG